MTSKKLKTGIIGMGYIGESHIDAVRRIGLCSLAAVADVNASLAQKKAAAFGIERWYGSVEELLNDPDIDVIHNCTPNHLHTEINRAVLAKGKHLLSEKPLAVSRAEAESLLALWRAHPECVVMVNFNYRMNPLVQEMKNRIARGEIGEVRLATGSYLQDWLLYDTDYNWRLEPEISGPSRAIADIGSHWMDAVQHVTGSRITEVMADLVTVVPVRKKPKNQTETFRTSGGADAYEERPIRTEDYGAVMFRLENGAAGVYYVSQVSAGHGCYLNFEINGSKASLSWNQEENDRLWEGFREEDNRLIIRNPNGMSPEARAHTALAKGHPEGWNDAFKGNIESFYRFIAEGKRQGADRADFATLEDAAYIVRLTEAILESGAKKAWVRV